MKRITAFVFIFGFIGLLAFLAIFIFNVGGMNPLQNNSTKGESIVHSNEKVGSTEDNTAEKSDDGLSSFIKENHSFYNETLGWGRDNNIKWEEQREQAESIQSDLENLTSEDNELQTDLDAINELVKTIAAGSKDKDDAIKLHRYFHDLDIVYNDYKDTKDFFKMTRFRGE